MPQQCDGARDGGCRHATPVPVEKDPADGCQPPPCRGGHQRQQSPLRDRSPPWITRITVISAGVLRGALPGSSWSIAAAHLTLATDQPVVAGALDPRSTWAADASAWCRSRGRTLRIATNRGRGAGARRAGSGAGSGTADEGRVPAGILRPGGAGTPDAGTTGI